MLFDETAARANIRNRDGKRVFYLGRQDHLTSAARDFLNRERIEILPAEAARPQEYKTLWGGTLGEKPEHMTHLSGNILVPKTHPRIAFRGAIDTLEAEILLCQLAVPPKTAAALDEILALARNLIRWEVMEEPVKLERLCGLTEGELRARSHRPQDFYGKPHFMPGREDAPAVLHLNRVRTAARNAELAACHAFTDQNGSPTRPDLLQALNRLSSMVYLLMIELKFS